MKQIIRYFFYTVIIISTFSCGNRKAPTGGKIDTENPVIVSVLPEPYADISKGYIEITFSKPMDRSSVYTGEGGLYFYPPISNKKYNWQDNTLIIEIIEELKADTNYYLTISETIRDLRNNPLEKSYFYMFNTGKSANNIIDGNIYYEKETDIGEEVTMTLLSADSLRIFSKRTSGDRFVLDNLNSEPYIIRAFIDKNNNRRYDAGRDPFFQAFVDEAKYNKVDIYLEYFDDVKPAIRFADAPYQNTVIISLNKPVEKLEKISITSSDSLAHKPEILSYDFINNTIEIITTPMDTLTYQGVITNIQDSKNNSADSLKFSFTPQQQLDETILSITEHYPRNGAVVETLMPELMVTFSKHTFTENIYYSLINTATKEETAVTVKRKSSRRYVFSPKNELRNRDSYRLIIFANTQDVSGNKLKEDFELNFLSIEN